MSTLGAGSDIPWEPIPDFDRTDADVSVHFLSQNSVVHLAPVYDPWFSANGTFNTTIDGNTYVASDDWVRVLACAEQYVICNPSASKCSSPAGATSLVKHIMQNSTLGWNTAQLSTANRIVNAMVRSGVFYVVADLGPGALWATNLLMGNLSPGLPDNQWQTEVLGWFQTGLARMQGLMLNFASTSIGVDRLGPLQPPGSSPLERLLVLPDQPGLEPYQYQCENQLVQAVGEVQNFSLCGVLVVVVGSVAIVLLDCCLERIVNAFSRRDSVSRRAREADSKLHLLRMALTRTPDKPSGWELGSWDVPVRHGADLVDEPTLWAGFTSYPRFPDVEPLSGSPS